MINEVKDMLLKRVEEKWYAGRKIFITFKIIEGYVSIPYLQKMSLKTFQKKNGQRIQTSFSQDRKYKCLINTWN